MNFTGMDDYMYNDSRLYISFDAVVVDDGNLVNIVNVTASECSPDTLFDEDSASVFVEPGPSMECRKLVMASDGSWVDGINASIGETVHFNISVTNIGTVQLYGIDVLDFLPSGLSYDVGSSEIHYNGLVYDAEPIVNSSLNTLLWVNLNFYTGEYLSPGETISVLFDAMVNSHGLWVNTANVTALRCYHGTILNWVVSASVNVSLDANHPPLISDPDPADNSTDVNYESVSLGVTVYDSDDDEMIVSFYDGSDDSFIDRVDDVDDGDDVSVSWDGDFVFNTSYTWYVKVNDEKVVVTSDVWSFTTGPEITNHVPNMPDNPSPYPGSFNIVTNPVLSVHVSDPDVGDSLNVRFYDASDNSLIGSDSCSSDCTASVSWSGLDYDTLYNWYVKVSDGDLEVTSSNWRFTTENIEIDIDLALKGGFGLTFNIENKGPDSASDVAWTLDVKSKLIFGRIDEVDGDVIPSIGSGSSNSVKMSIFGFGRVEIIATAACKYAEPPPPEQKNAFVIGPIVIL